MKMNAVRPLAIENSRETFRGAWIAFAVQRRDVGHLFVHGETMHRSTIVVQVGERRWTWCGDDGLMMLSR